MRGVSFSDTHLGYRAFASTTDGRNSRETDIERAFHRVVEHTIAADPDLVLIPGDVFQNPRPSLHAIKTWRDGVRRILDALPQVEIVTLIGNHDAARMKESLSPVLIPDDLDHFRVVSKPERLHFTIPRTGETVAVAAFPFVGLGGDEVYRLTPDESAQVNILCMHAAVRGSPDADRLPVFYTGSNPIDVGREAERWDAVILGDYHEFTRLHPTAIACYPGAIERTTSNIWNESAEKGIIVFDTETGELEFVEHETRPVDDLALANPDGPMSAEILNAMLGQILDNALTGQGELDGRIVRLVVEDFPRADRDDIDWARIRDIKHRALAFQIDLRWADRSASPTHSSHRQAGRPLADRAREFLADDPEDVRRCALGYLGFEEEPAHEPAKALPPGEIILVCADCGTRDSIPPDWSTSQPCSGDCGGTMEPEAAEAAV